ncbi:MAG: hypothetical protein NTW87_17355 [Planctomycetota bacterium]|nr:hypothetical protein [Planctomycetota bacterium]
MMVYFCSTCGATVPEQTITNGTAIRKDNNQVYCYRCITTRVANITDSDVYRAIVAKKSQGAVRQVVKSVSQRLLTQMPDGRLRRVVKSISDRVFLPRTAQYKTVAGSSPRNRVPASTLGAVAAATRRRTEARNLAVAGVAFVVVAIGTVILYMASGKRGSGDAVAARPTTATVPAKAEGSVPQASPGTSAAAPADGGGAAPTVGTKAPATPLVIPPLLTEREGGTVSTKDFKARLAQDRLEEARNYQREHPTETSAYHRKLGEIVNTYRGTPAAEEAAKLLAALPVPEQPQPPQPAPPPKPATSLEWFAAWQVENLERRAKARMFEELGGRKFVLETYPPDPAESLRLKQKAKVPADKPFLELSVRAPEQGEFGLAVEAAGKKTTVGTVRGTEWQTFAVDLSASKGQEVAVTLHHATIGGQTSAAYWQAPTFVPQPAATATVLSWAGEGTDVAAKTDAPARVVDLLVLVQPHRDAVAGVWTSKDGALVSDKTLYARVAIPYAPPQEYDFRVRFTRQEGTDSVTQIMSRGERSFGWVMGGVNNTVFGFETVGGVSAMANPTTVKRTACLENGKAYTSLVQVRKTGLKAYLDGQLVCQWRTDFSDMDVYKDWKLPMPGILGVGSWNGPTVFHSIELVEIAGKGKALRGDTAATSAARSSDPKLEYEAALFEIYGLVASKGVQPALERLEQIKTNPILTPLRAKLDLDAECIGFTKDVRETGLAAAAKLPYDRAFTFVKADGKEVAVGPGTQRAVAGVTGTAITIEESSAGAKASTKLEYSDLAPQTQQDLLRLGTTAAGHADLKLAVMKLARFSGEGGRSVKSPLPDEVRAHLEAARKNEQLAQKAEHLLGQLAFFQRDFEAQQRFQAFEVLCKQQKWREAKAAADEFKAEYVNSYAMERAKPILERWLALIEKETASPLLKR